jgi:hypothetical protein
MDAALAAHKAETAALLTALDLQLVDARALAARLAAENALLSAQLHASPPLTAAQGQAAAAVARARAHNALRRRSELLQPVPTRGGAAVPPHWPHNGLTPKDIVEGSPHLLAKLLGDYGELATPLAAPLPGDGVLRASLGRILGCMGE